MGRSCAFECSQNDCNGGGHIVGRFCDVTQPNLICMIETKEKPVDDLNKK